MRELEHVIERAVIVAEGTDITLEDLPPTIRDAERLPNQTGFVIPPHHTLEEIEKLAILQTLERTRGNKRKAASILGVYRPTLYNKLKKYNLIETQERAPRVPTPAAPAAGRAAHRAGLQAARPVSVVDRAGTWNRSRNRLHAAVVSPPSSVSTSPVM